MNHFISSCTSDWDTDFLTSSILEPVKLRHFRSQPNEHHKVTAYTPHLTYDDEIQGEKPQQDGVNPTKVLSLTPTKEKDCVLTCSLTAVQPVCGSDGNTYLNPCLLKLRSCMSKHPDELYVVHWGYCPARPPGKFIFTPFCDFIKWLSWAYSFKQDDLSHSRLTSKSLCEFQTIDLNSFYKTAH